MGVCGRVWNEHTFLSAHDFCALPLQFSYSFDGMPKPSNWRELDEYQYLLLEVGDDAASAPAPPQRRHERRQVEEQEHEAHTFQEYGGGEHSSGESLDDFESWEKEMAEADNIREESFLETIICRLDLSGGRTFRCAKA